MLLSCCWYLCLRTVLSVNAFPQVEQVKRAAYVFYIVVRILEAILQCIYISKKSPKGIPWRTVFLKGYLVASVVGR